MLYAGYFDYQLTLSRLIELKANPNIRGSYGRTPLLMALNSGIKRTDSLNKLIAAGTDVNLVDTANNDALIVATKKGYEDITNKILIAGSSVSTRTTNGLLSALHWAAYKGFDEIIQQLIDYKVDVNIRESKGETALMKAALQNHLSSVNVLLIAGHEEDINAQQKYGNTALVIAAQNGFDNVVA